MIFYSYPINPVKPAKLKVPTPPMEFPAMHLETKDSLVNIRVLCKEQFHP